MKQFISFVKKEFYHIFRDRQTLFILMGMPIVLIVIFGFALTNEVKNARFAVLNLSNDNVTKELIEELDASRYFDLTEIVYSYKDIEALFRKGDVKMAVVFPNSFETNLKRFNKEQVQLVSDASDPNTATTLTAYATTIIKDYEQRITDEEKIPYTINTRVRMLYNPQSKGAYSFVPGVMAIVLMLVCTLMTSITVVREKERGTMEVLLVSPMQPLKILLAKAVPYLLLSIINILCILILSVFVLGVPIKGNLFLLISECILFTITCLSLGLLISSASDSQQVAMFISLTGMFLPTIMLSGFMFPVENMPMPLRILSNIVPARWFYTIVKSVMIKGVGMEEVWLPTIILFAMTVVLLGLSFKKFKIRLA